MTEREKMLAGYLYDCGDKELLSQWHKAKDLVRDYNRTDSANTAEKERILNELLGCHPMDSSPFQSMLNILLKIMPHSRIPKLIGKIIYPIQPISAPVLPLLWLYIGIV